MATKIRHHKKNSNDTLTPIKLILSPMKHFEDNLGEFINDKNIADNKKNYFCFKIPIDEKTNIKPLT